MALVAPLVDPCRKVDLGPGGYAVSVTGTVNSEIHQGLRCWDFTGATNYLTVSTPAMTGNVSVVLIVKPASLTNETYVLDFGANNEFAIITGYQDGYYNAFGDNYPILNTATNSRLPMSGGWDVLAYATEGTIFNGFVNGQHLVRGTITIGDWLPSASLEIGRAFGASPYFIGKLALCAIYNRTITSDEMRLLTADKFALFRQVQYLPLHEEVAGGGGADTRRFIIS